ncbi:MAG: hypothetical protein AABP62_11825 [Planctomycetota bacterium]
MSFALLVTAALIGPHASLSADQWRDEYKAALLATAERAKPRPEEAVPRLVSLYVSLEHVDALPRGERTRMRQTLQTRLVKQLEVLLREKRKHELAQQRPTSRRSTDDSLAGGGATAFAAQQLINLIVTTIAPDSWKQTGGKGSISFYARNPALIIRQTSEVHGEMADLLRALRP